MAEDRRATGQRLENLNLYGCIGDVILAANDMRDAEVDVVDHGGKGIEIGPVLALEDGIGERRAIDMAFAANEVVPAHDFGLEAKAPVGASALRLERRALLRGQTQRGAIVDRRPPERLLTLAAAIELLRGLVAGVEPT
jgi:hypothetical protein